jgi:outer membrane protein OmpA-like peptidoglycan-associated protein
MNRLRTRNTLTLSLTALLVLGLTLLTGCASLGNTEKGAATGAGAGAVIGGVIGKATGSTAKGAIIGGVVGGTAGAIIGQQMDKQAEELEDDLEGADVATIENPETGETAGIEVTFDSALLFDFDSSNLRSGARRDLGDLAQSLENYPKTDVLVVGHTDARGTDRYNQDLSERRADGAAGYLMERGVRPSRITTLGKGESEAVASNDTEYGRQQNRRVEIAIYAGDEYREEAQRQARGNGGY